MPLVDPDGFALGTLCVIDRTPQALPRRSVEILETLAQAVMTILQLRRAVRQIEAVAMTDMLTSLPNRPAFLLALDQAIARQVRDRSPFSLLYLDLDRFKHINDTFGHNVGDRLLVAAAAAFRACMRVEDTPARLGGDEFGAVLVGGDGSEAVLVAQRVRAGIEQQMLSGGWDVTASIGSLLFQEPPASAAAAVAAADRLMYEAKAAGRNQVAYGRFSQELATR